MGVRVVSQSQTPDSETAAWDGCPCAGVGGWGGWGGGRACSAIRRHLSFGATSAWRTGYRRRRGRRHGVGCCGLISSLACSPPPSALSLPLILWSLLAPCQLPTSVTGRNGRRERNRRAGGPTRARARPPAPREAQIAQLKLPRHSPPAAPAPGDPAPLLPPPPRVWWWWCVWREGGQKGVRKD